MDLLADLSSLPAQLIALGQVLLIDLSLAGDNAVVVGMAVNGLPAHQKRPAILFGIAGATALRVGLGAVALQVLHVIGLVLAGGLLLMWVCWRMFRELRRGQSGEGQSLPPAKSLRAAIFQIVLADLSMSLDNVLAVAGAARGDIWVLVSGLVLSVALMGLAASLIARLLERNPWLAWLGLMLVFYIANSMIWSGGNDVLRAVGG